MLSSMQKYGQLTRWSSAGSPLVSRNCSTASSGSGRPQLGLKELTVRNLDVSLRACKVCMLQLNRVGRAISVMEEALVVHSLCHEDGLNQVEIAFLLDRHKSWVCRRISLIERLSDEAQQSIRLGLLPASIGAELSRLQRCNQERLLAAIREQSLTWRETRKVVAALLISSKQESEAILRDPRGTALQPEDDILVPPCDGQGLSQQARVLLRRLLTLEKSSINVAALFFRYRTGSVRES